MTLKKSPVILLHADDNVLILREPVRTDDSALQGDTAYRFFESIDVGHKVARFDLKAGQKAIKYGVAIGTLTTDVPAGGHIHIHNLKSDYIKSHARGGH